MRTNIVIDDRLMQRAMRASGLKTKRAAVEAGLELLIRVKAQAGVRRLRGKVTGPARRSSLKHEQRNEVANEQSRSRG
jgi:Arc/MetJ family transcription regulator